MDACQVVVVGGGAAGMFAAIHAAEYGADVTLIEQNEKLGKKLFITGKGRCNVTNACERDAFFASVLRGEKFLYSAYAQCDVFSVMDFFETEGVSLKVERGNRVFPQSDHSSDIIKALERRLKAAGIKVRLHTAVKDLCVEDDRVKDVLLSNGEKIACDACILATGGVSYPTTGSTGDGHRFAKKLGHTCSPLLPGLVPMTVMEDWIHELMGLSLRNVEVSIYDEGKLLYQDFGEMLFTHFGVSGPLILSASSIVGERLQKKPLTLSIDLKPALSKEQLDKRLIRELQAASNKDFQNAIASLFPKKLLPVIVRISKIDPHKKANEITKEEREHFGDLMKHFSCTLDGLRGFNEAIITRGGIEIKDVIPKTMASKKINNLYFAGEMLDLDAVTGGFNLQIAWATGFVAGHSAAMQELI